MYIGAVEGHSSNAAWANVARVLGRVWRARPSRGGGLLANAREHAADLRGQERHALAADVALARQSGSDGAEQALPGCQDAGPELVACSLAAATKRTTSRLQSRHEPKPCSATVSMDPSNDPTNTEAIAAPLDGGEKVTSNVHWAPGASALPEHASFVSAKRPGVKSETDTARSIPVAPGPAVTVKVLGGDVDPTATVLN
jgi:hypothetical protein